MAILHVVSGQAVSGKTAIAVGLARGLAAAGHDVQLFRIGAGRAAQSDAALLASYPFAASPGAPVSPDVVPGAAAIAIAEWDAGQGGPDGPALLVVRAAASDADLALARSLGDRLIGTIATIVHPTQVESVARDLTNAGLRPLALLPEDRALGAPGVSEIQEALAAEVLSEGEDPDASIEDVVIAPVYTDPARTHFGRYGRTAILTPSYKTDLQLAAIESGTVCLVITGGQKPSPYVLDRVRHEPTTLLLAPQPTTVAAIEALSDVWTNSRFRGEEKAAAIYALLAARLDFAAFARKLE
jgi:BioD-like phosphotransacetylase family protein